MKHKLLLLFLIASVSVFSQRRIEDIPSVKLGENRRITIALPGSYESSPDKKYPLLLLLDGDYLLDPFAGTLSYATYWQDLPEVIIVGIEQNNGGQRDFDCYAGHESGVPEAKGQQFYEFIAQEVIPLMEEKYRAAPFRIIAGHGLTAGYLNFFLYKDNPLFSAYISISPEYPVEMETRLPLRLKAMKKPTFYYLSTADGDVSRLRKKVEETDEAIKAVANTMLRYRFDKFEGVSHYSLVPSAIPNALYHIFDYYKPISPAEYEEKLVKLPSGYVKYVEDKYDLTEKELGLKMTIRLNDFKAAEAAIIKNGAFDELQDLAKLARKNYPKTLVGEYYEAKYEEKKGNLKRAIKIYTNSYDYEEIGDLTRDYMLEQAETLKSKMQEE
jgi:predicted alpha/beta superfamily hydrolase